MVTTIRKKIFLISACAGALIAIAGIGVVIYHYHSRRPAGSNVNVYVNFDMEAYDSIKQNYWNTVSDAQLSQLFQAAVGKAMGLLEMNTDGSTTTVPVLLSDDRTGTVTMLTTAMNATSSADGKQALALGIVQVALYNLLPLGRDELDSNSQVTALRQEVSNINPSANLYGSLGVATSSDVAAITTNYDQKVAALSTATSSAAKLEIKQLSYAYNVLSNNETRSLYDQTAAEPTVWSHSIGNTLYIYIEKMSPSTPQEFVWAVNAASTTPGLNSMIIDLRGNIGGELAVDQGLAGFFLGNNQYAFDLYHQGNYNVQRTLLGSFNELDRYRNADGGAGGIAVLVDHSTQSSAELLTEILQHFNIARVVGVTTAGWGTIENTYPLQTNIDIDPASPAGNVSASGVIANTVAASSTPSTQSTTYALFLVNSITLGSDGQSIQGIGVTPDVSITSPDWQSQLSTYFSSPSLIKAIEKAVAEGPVSS